MLKLSGEKPGIYIPQGKCETRPVRINSSYFNVNIINLVPESQEKFYFYPFVTERIDIVNMYILSRYSLSAVSALTEPENSTGLKQNTDKFRAEPVFSVYKKAARLRRPIRGV